MSILKVKGVKKLFGTAEVINGIDLCVDKGDVTAIIGSSGSGKTTLLRCISFLEKPDAGELTIGEGENERTYDMAHVSRSDIKQIRSHMGFVFQNYNLFSNLNALQNCMEGLVTARHMDKKEAALIAEKCLERVGLKDRMKHFPAELSGGQQQRVAIARALAIGPDIMLFDEPTSALDPELTIEVLDTIRSLAEEGTTMLVVTHEMKFAREVANKGIFIEDGSIVEEGSAPQIFDAPSVARTREFLKI